VLGDMQPVANDATIHTGFSDATAALETGGLKMRFELGNLILPVRCFAGCGPAASRKRIALYFLANETSLRYIPV